MKKEVTTINIDGALLQEARNSGVRNISRYIDSLMRADLKSLQKVGKAESRKVEHIDAELDKLRDRWHAYVKRKGVA